MFNIKRMFKMRWVKVTGITLMIIVIFLGSLFGYAYIKITQLKNTLKTCDLTQSDFIHEIDFDYSSGIIVVQARINGSQKTYPFILDTGAVTVISQRMIGELHIKTNTMAGMKVNNGEALKPSFLTLDSLQLGEVTFSRIGALVMDNEKLGRLNCISPYGIIGCNVLKSTVFQLNYQTQRITITDDIDKLQHVNDACEISYQTSIQETPEMSVTIDEAHKEILLLDTGHSGFLSIDSSQNLKNYEESDISRIKRYQCQQSITIQGDLDVKSKISKYHYQTKHFGMGPIELSNLIIDITEHEEGFSQMRNGLIGNKFLENFIMTLDYQNHLVYLKQQPFADFSRKQSILGLGYTVKDNGIYVQTVYENSEASEAGIDIGDQIISINGVDVSFIPEEEVCDIFLGEKTFKKSDDDTITLEVLSHGNKILHLLSRFKLYKIF